MNKYAIVTLVDLAQRPDQLIDRLFKLASVLVDTEFILSIGHGDRSSSKDIKLKKKLAHFKHVQFSSVKPAGKDVELARMRNQAVSNLDSSIVLLVDVDIYPDLKLFRNLVAEVERGIPLSMAPCIYLTASGTRLVEKGKGEFVINSALGYSPKHVMHWALPSSVIAIRLSDYLAVGGFHERYKGHGYEDFDFMINISLHVKLIEPADDLLVDKTYRAPLLSSGFRAVLGSLCLANLLDGNIAFHLHHKKDPQSTYKIKRKTNAEIFQQRIGRLICTEVKQSYDFGVPKIVSNFFLHCAKKDIHPERFYALFDGRPRFLQSNTFRKFYKIFT